MPNFRQRVFQLVKKIPKGQVVSYGQVAAALGSPTAARQVGWALHSLDESQNGIPWWRVVNNQGVLTIKGNWEATKELQRQLLLKEGIDVADDYTLNIEKYRFHFK